ncbi:MAG: hypothetical protein AAGG59_02605 [Bacteroidota bacterium]
MKSPKRVLENHTRLGKKLLPPLMNLNLKEISYVQYVIPELIWIAILNKKYGLKKGTELGLELVRLTSTLSLLNNNFSYISSYELLNNSVRKRILTELNHRGVLGPIQDGLFDFVSIYPECPLSFLVDSSTNSKDKLQGLKEILLDLYDKKGATATFMMGNVLYFMGVMGKLRLVKGSPMDNLPELQNYPETLDSRIIASGVRATIFAMIGKNFISASGNWNKYFWKRGIELEPCQI